MSKLVELHDVTKIYEIGDEIRVKALQGASLTVDKKEMVSIMGPSGCGKSTLLNMIGGLDNPTSGQVIIDGVDITDMNEGELASFRGERIGFIFQSYNLVPTLTALENVELPMIFAEKYASKEISERAADMLGLVGLGERLHHRPNQLSGGQQQRVAIARALANEPSIIIADEPTGNIDRKTGLKIIRFFQHLNKTLGQTFILVTHDPDIARVSQRILHMLDGKITSRPAKTSIKPSKQILLEEQRQLMLAELKWLENSLTRLEESKANLTPVLYDQSKTEYARRLDSLDQAILALNNSELMKK